MRDILEDAEGAVERGDIGPGKANRGQDKQKFPKRFYEAVSIAETETGFGVELDGKTVKTPGRVALEMPTSESAQLVADEWSAITDEINPLLMPVTRLANTAVDGVANEMQAVMEDIVRYSSSDLLCYRADGPAGLVDAQRKHWDPILDWMDNDVGARFELAEGIMHINQPKEAIAAVGVRLKNHEEPFKLACVHTFTSLSGSALIALALAEGCLDADAAWNAAHVDEDWNVGQWGEDHEAAARRKQRHMDFTSAHRLLCAVGL